MLEQMDCSAIGNPSYRFTYFNNHLDKVRIIPKPVAKTELFMIRIYPGLVVIEMLRESTKLIQRPVGTQST